MHCDICQQNKPGMTTHNVYNFGEVLSINPYSKWVNICFDCNDTSPCSGKWGNGMITCRHGNRWKIVAWWEECDIAYRKPRRMARIKWVEQSPKWYAPIVSLFSKCKAK